MSVSPHFSQSYREARAKFLAAVHRGHATSIAFENPAGLGPDGETLATDVALFGPEQARNLLVIMSGVHGVEGFAGSGCQIAMIEAVRFASLPTNTAVLVVHAMNPFGFAWLRRVNEDNVDVNRNAIDHSKQPPINTEYEALHPYLIPALWDGPRREAADAALSKYIAEHGERAFQQAVAAGQYTHPDGLFYGGKGPVWSALTFAEIIKRWGCGKERIGLIDLHTGLGVPGKGELLYPGHDAAELSRAQSWFAPELKVIDKAQSEATPIEGPLTGVVGAILAAQGERPEVTAIALEYGTVPRIEVLQMLRAEHWLHKHGDAGGALSRAIKKDFRNAFYIDTQPWKAAVVERAFHVTTCALAGLAS